MHDGNQPRGVMTGKTDRRVSDARAAGYETCLTKMRVAGLDLKRLGASGDGHYVAIWANRLTIDEDLAFRVEG